MSAFLYPVSIILLIEYKRERERGGKNTRCKSLWILDITLFDLRMQLGHALVIKRHLAAYEDVQDNAKTPDVDFGSSILPGLQQFGSGKVETATERFEKTSGRKEITETEVDDLDIARFAD